MYVKKNTTERIWVSALDIDNQFLSGLDNVFLQIQRKSDNYFYDFADKTFKDSGWVSKQMAMSENVDLVGVYYYDFEVPDLLEVYLIRILCSTAANSPWEDEINAKNTDTDEIYELTKRILGLSQENYRIFSPVYNCGGQLLSCLIKIYNTATDCDNDQNAFAVYALESTYTNGQMNSYKVTLQ